MSIIDRPNAPVHDRKANARPQADSPPTVDEIARWLSLFASPDDGIEIRAPKATRKGSKALVDEVRRFPGESIDEAAKVAYGFSGHAPGVYFVLNGIKPALVSKRGGGSNADHIRRRRFLLIDCDPIKPKEVKGTVSSTDGEKAASESLSRNVRAALDALGWPQPITADSGNGFHLVYAIDLPNDRESEATVKAVLKALAARHDTDTAKVDTKLFDAPRLVKLYGTRSMKGDHSAERPHRFSRVLEKPDELVAVGADQLAALGTEGKPLAQPAPSPAAGEGRPLRTREGGRRDPVERAIAYIAKCQPAIDGEAGHNQTFKVAAKIGPGFDLDPETAFRLVRDHFNPRCIPPWTEREVRHKIDDAYQEEPRRGFLLNVDRPPTARPPMGDDGGASLPPIKHGGHGEGPRVISITTQEYRVIDEAIDALSHDANIFQRGNMLMTILRDDAPKNRDILRPAGSPRIAALPAPRLRELLTRHARWVKWRKTKEGDEELPAHPPDWAVSGVAARGSWPEINPIEAVIETPALRPDGTIVDRPGYDERTALLYEPNAPFPAIAARPNLAAARRAADELLGLVVDFPFAGESHRAAWLASLLTPLARFAIAGPCPLFLIDANTPGTGKSKLTDIVAIISTGRVMPRTSYPDTDDEMRKRISSIAMAGDRLMLLDNIATTFGGSALDSALTAMTWRDRILGRSEMTSELPLFTVWYATGNNVTLRGDVLRRIIPCRLETKEERPEERRAFTIGGDLLEHVHRERPRLVAQALTILRAHAEAGRPDGGLYPLGSFEAWSRIVRSAVLWATGLDPCETREELRASDPEALGRVALIEGFAELLKVRSEDGLTAAAALKLVKDTPSAFDKLRDAFMDWSRNDDLPSARSVGRRLKALKGRVINGMYFTSTEDRGTQVWRIEEAGRVE